MTEAKPHWFLTIYRDRVTGRCSDGRTFVEPSSSISVCKGWLRGFCTAARMAGWTFETRDGVFERIRRG